MGQKKNEQEPPLQCRDCGFVFDPNRKKKDYTRTATGVMCKDRRSCRSRKLAIDLEIDLFSRNPRERLIEKMQVQPKDWKKKGWKPIPGTEMERVEAALEYFSWCFPVSMAYVVQIDADDEIIKDRYGNPKAHSHRSLAEFLGMHGPNVSRAIKQLEQLKRLRQEDGRVYLEPKPHLSLADRTAISTDSGLLSFLGLTEDDPAVPAKWVPILADLLRDAPAAISTDTVAVVKAACTGYNEAHQRIRTERDAAIQKAVTAAATLLSRPLTLEQEVPGERVSSTHEASPAKNPPVEGLVSDASAVKPADTKKVRRPAEPEDESQPYYMRPSFAAQPEPTDAGYVEARNLLFSELRRMQRNFPHTQFSLETISPDKPNDLVLVRRIIAAVHGAANVMGYILSVAAKFKGLDVNSLAKMAPRSPGAPKGPRSFGLLLLWAEDYGRSLMTAVAGD